MTKFTKYQANYIKQNYSHLIGKDFGKGLKISRIWIVPIDQNFELIARKYQFEKATTYDIATTYGKGQNLNVIVLSTDAIKTSGILLQEDIADFLTSKDLDKILKMEEK